MWKILEIETDGPKITAYKMQDKSFSSVYGLEVQHHRTFNQMRKRVGACLEHALRSEGLADGDACMSIADWDHLHPID